MLLNGPSWTGVPPIDYLISRLFENALDPFHEKGSAQDTVEENDSFPVMIWRNMRQGRASLKDEGNTDAG